MNQSEGGSAGGVELPASCTMQSQFPPPFIVIPASVCISCYKILCNVANIFLPLFLPAPTPLAIPPPAASSPTIGRLPVPMTPGFPPPCATQQSELEAKTYNQCQAWENAIHYIHKYALIVQRGGGGNWLGICNIPFPYAFQYQNP